MPVMTPDATPPGVSLRSNRMAVLAAFFAQGFVFVSATLFIPRIIVTFGLTAASFSMFLLGMVLAAAVGSAIAEAVARRAGSAAALRAGLVVMAPALALLFVTGSLPGVAAGMVLYGIALGMVDAGSNMQAVTLERRYGRPILPSSQGAWTVGGIVATVASFAGMANLPLSAGAAFAVVPVIAAFTPFQGRDVVVPGPTTAAPSGPRMSPAPAYGVDSVPGPDPTRAVTPTTSAAPGVRSLSSAVFDDGPAGVSSPTPDPTSWPTGRPAGSPTSSGPVPARTASGTVSRVPWGAIAPAGIAFLLFYLVDAAAQTWGPVFLTQTLGSPMSLVAAATLPYLAATLLARLAGDALTARFGAPALVRAGAIIACVGLAVVALAPAWPFAVVGFFATGLGLGAVAPLSFSAAGQIAGGDRARADVVVARFNQLNYVGALLGSVVTELVGALSLRISFAVPILLVLALIPLARGFASVPTTRAS